MMNSLLKVVFPIIFLFVLSGQLHAQDKEYYKITAKIKNAKDNVFYLGYPYGEKKYMLDTAVINDAGEIIFEGNRSLYGGLMFMYTPNNMYFEFVGAPNVFGFETDTLDYIGNMKIEGSKENELFQSFDQFMKDKQVEVKELQQKLQETTDETEKAKLQNRFKEIDGEVKAFRSKLIEENKGTFVASLVNATVEPSLPEELQGADAETRYFYVKDHYFDNIDFSDNRLLYTPVLHRKMLDYVDKLSSPHPDSVLASAKRVIELSRANDDVFRYAVVTLVHKYETSKVMGQDAVFVGLAESYYLTGEATWADSTLMSKIKTKVRELHPLIGEPAPEMILTDTTLTKNYSLYRSIKSDYTVLYFYADDCGHCKKKTPEWHDTYVNELKKRNVEVLAIDINLDVDEWKKFVREFELTWLNLADPNRQDNFRYLYTIDRTPKVYIVDAEKKVIAKDLDAEQIPGFIDKMNEIAQNE